MSSIQAEVFEALRAIDIPKEKALKAAAALSRRDTDGMGVKADLASLANRVALKDDLTPVRADLADMTGDVKLLKGMLPFLLAFQVAILVKLFMH
jgi:hypothetical protein